MAERLSLAFAAAGTNARALGEGSSYNSYVLMPSLRSARVDVHAGSWLRRGSLLCSDER